MQRMMDTVPKSLYSTAADGKATFFNKRARDYVGMTLDQLLGWGWVQAIHPEERGYVVREFTKALASGRSYGVEYRFRRAGGIYRWYLSRAEPLRDENGEIARGFGISVDVDEGKRAEAHFPETCGRLHA